MKRRHLLLLAGLLGAAWLAAYGNTAFQTDLARPTTASARKSDRQSSANGTSSNAEASQASTDRTIPREQSRSGELRILTLRPRAELIVDRETRSADRQLFSTTTWAPPVSKAKLAPPPPPVAPPLPFAYLGKQMVGGVLEVYVSRGDSVFTLRNQSVIEGTYRVESIAPPTMSLMYLPLNQLQKLSIGVTN